MSAKCPVVRGYKVVRKEEKLKSGKRAWAALLVDARGRVVNGMDYPRGEPKPPKSEQERARCVLMRSAVDHKRGWR